MCRSLHERIREALDTHVATKLYPAKVATLAGLGPEQEWQWVRHVAEALPRYLDAPKVWTPDALAQGIADGVQQGVFGYSATAMEKDGKLAVATPSAVRMRETMAPEQISLGDGAALIGVPLAERLAGPPTPPGLDGPTPPGPGPRPPLPPQPYLRPPPPPRWA